MPVFHARLEPDAGFVAALGGGRVLAFAGIGDPEKFFATLSDAGSGGRRDPQLSRPSPLHAPRRRRRCARRPTARASILVTTEKDLARLTGDDGVAELAARAHALPVTLAFDDEGSFKTLLLERIAAARANA